MSELQANALTNDELDQIKHYGVLGMKWGVRRDRNGVTRPSGKKARGRRSEDRRRSDSLRENPLSTLSNDELQRVNRRLQLETTYSELTNKTSPAHQRMRQGQAIVKGVLSTATMLTALYKLYQSPLVQIPIAWLKDEMKTQGYAAIRRQIMANR